MIRIHPTADVSPKAVIGENTSIWHQCQVREGAHLGEECILGKNVYVDFDVQIGSRVKIQNNCSVYHGADHRGRRFPGAARRPDQRPLPARDQSRTAR